MFTLVLVLVLGCDEEPETESSGESTGTPVEYEPGSQLFGQPCNEDADCSTGVCWNYADHDEFCTGKVCSATCEEPMDCYDIAAEGDASTPLVTECFDNLCDPPSAGVSGLSC